MEISPNLENDMFVSCGVENNVIVWEAQGIVIKFSVENLFERDLLFSQH
jgi:hypothetical protein